MTTHYLIHIMIAKKSTFTRTSTAKKPSAEVSFYGDKLVVMKVPEPIYLEVHRVLVKYRRKKHREMFGQFSDTT